MAVSAKRNAMLPYFLQNFTAHTLHMLQYFANTSTTSKTNSKLTLKTSRAKASKEPPICVLVYQMFFMLIGRLHLSQSLQKISQQKVILLILDAQKKWMSKHTGRGSAECCGATFRVKCSSSLLSHCEQWETGNCQAYANSTSPLWAWVCTIELQSQ